MWFIIHLEQGFLLRVSILDDFWEIATKSWQITVSVVSSLDFPHFSERSVHVQHIKVLLQLFVKVVVSLHMLLPILLLWVVLHDYHRVVDFHNATAILRWRGRLIATFSSAFNPGDHLIQVKCFILTLLFNMIRLLYIYFLFPTGVILISNIRQKRRTDVFHQEAIVV